MSPMKRRDRLSINYGSSNVALLCMSPSIVLSALLIPSRPVLVWVLWGFLSLLACGAFYAVMVTMRLPARIPTGLRFLACLLAQAAFWYLLIHFNAA